MCGRYRLSRRKQLIAEYFETDQRGRLGASLQHRPVAACRNYSPRSIQARAALLASSLGPDSVLGHRRQYRIQDDQCPRGDGRE